MKHYLSFVICFFGILNFISCTSEEEKRQEQNLIIENTISAFEKALLTEDLNAIFDKNKFNGSISVMKDGKLLYERSNGLENFKTQAELDSSSIFAIGSISKQFTASLILLEQEKDQLNINDKVSDYLEEFRTDQYGNITIHQLLNHSSGITDFGTSLKFKSGTDFHYSNKGYRFLGEILEQVSNQPYENLVQSLFEKAQLTDTYTPQDFQNQNFAGAHIGDQSNFTKVENMPERLTKKNISVPAGGILSTVSDLHRWNFALHQGKILQPTTYALLTKKSINRDHFLLGKVGYGYGIMSNLDKPTAYFHTGYVKGSPSLLIYYPTTKTSVVILSNIANEIKGMEHLFSPHGSIKHTLDNIENTIIKVKKELIKKEKK